jgi:hypothetical protein
MQVQRRQQRADGLGPALEQRQDPALEAFRQPADARAADRDRPHAQAQAARLPEAIPIAPRGVDPRLPLIAPAPQHPVDLLLQDPLQQLLHPTPGKRLQVFPDHRAGVRP